MVQQKHTPKTMESLQSEEKGKKCPECGGEIVFKDNEFVCKKCGLVIE